MLPSLLSLAALLAPVLAHPTSSSSTRAIYTFPNGTWLENLALAGDGRVLVTDLSTPALYAIDPSAASPGAVPVATFDPAADGVDALIGVARVQRTAYFVAANISLDPPAELDGRIYSVALSQAEAKPRLVASFPDTTFLNGLAVLSPRTLLAADSNGRVLAVDTARGNYSVVVQGDPLLVPPSGTGPGALGVNGIKVAPARRAGDKTWLYFTNTDRKILGRVQIDAVSGVAKGAAEVVYTFTAGPDDFALDNDTGEAFVSLGTSSEIVRVARAGGAWAGEVVAGGQNQTVLLGPTAVALRKGPRGRTLFVSTNGGLETGPPVTGGRLVEVDL